MKIRQLTSHDAHIFAEALELLDRTQGQGLFDSTYMNKRTADPLSYVLGAFEGNRLIGIGVAQVINSVEYYLPFDPSIVDELSNKVIGSFSNLCVHEDFQGQGIGQKMSHLRLEWLKQHGADVVLGISWVSGLPHTSDRVFEKLGFSAVKKLNDFFYQSSLAHPFICAGCGEPPCTCPAILYKLKIHR